MTDIIRAFLDDPKSYLATCAERYAKTRYLRHVPNNGLNIRANDIMGNLWTTDASGAVTGLSEPQRREYFMRLYAEFLEEQRLRASGQVIDFDEAAIRVLASTAYTAPRLMTTTPTLGTGSLVRFGKYAHLEGALTKGTLRIFPPPNIVELPQLFGQPASASPDFSPKNLSPPMCE